MDRNIQKRRLAAGAFVSNNGSVLRTINILRHEYQKLKGLQYALPDLEKDEVLDSVNFLSRAGYIDLRVIDTRERATLADNDFDDLEAILTDNGIRLLAGGISDNKTVQYQVIAYPSGNMLYAEIHIAGLIEIRKYKYDQQQKQIGTLLKSETALTGLNDFAVQALTNLTHSSDVYGVDDYEIVNSLIRKIMWRLHCADTILDKHSEPSMSGPESALKYDERTDKWYVPIGNYFSRPDANAPPLEYITWNGNLESNFKEIEMLFNQLYILTEMGQAFNDAGGGEASSGTALKLRMVSPRIKAQRISCLNEASVKMIVSMLAQINNISIDYDTLTIKWHDGLPVDEVEEINTLTAATGGQPVMSQWSALKQRGLSDAEVEKELDQMAAEAAQRQPTALSVVDRNTNTPPGGNSGDKGVS